jgi:hypothetical protein
VGHEIRSYRDLVAWRLAVDASVAVYRVTERFPDHERYGLTQQLRRAAVSIPSNVALAGLIRSVDSPPMGPDRSGAYMSKLMFSDGAMLERSPASGGGPMGPTVTKDGVSRRTSRKEIELAEPLENMGAKMVIEVAKKTNDKAGDGTTAATVLAEAIFLEGLRHVAAGANPVAVQRGINAAAQAAADALEGMATPARARPTTRRSPPSAPTTTRRSAS